MRGRKKAELRLRAAGNAAPPHPPVSHCNLGLDHLIAGAARVAGRVEKSDQPLPLVVLQKIPTDRQG